MILVSESHGIFSHFWGTLTLLAAGAGGMSTVAHAVDTFPTDGLGPKQLWLLGMIKYIVGQRITASSVMTQSKSLSVTQQLSAAKDDLRVAIKEDKQVNG